MRDELGRLSLDENFRDCEAADGHCSVPYSAQCLLSVSPPTLTFPESAAVPILPHTPVCPT